MATLSGVPNVDWLGEVGGRQVMTCRDHVTGEVQYFRIDPVVALEVASEG